MVATFFPADAATSAKPCSRSQTRSSTDSRPTESADRPGRDPGGRQLVVAQLPVGGAGGVDDQALRVADVRQVGPEVAGLG